MQVCLVDQVAALMLAAGIVALGIALDFVLLEPSESIAHGNEEHMAPDECEVYAERRRDEA